jgi:hypothetical protein
MLTKDLRADQFDCIELMIAIEDQVSGIEFPSVAVDERPSAVQKPEGARFRSGVASDACRMGRGRQFKTNTCPTAIKVGIQTPSLRGLGERL